MTIVISFSIMPHDIKNNHLFLPDKFHKSGIFLIDHNFVHQFFIVFRFIASLSSHFVSESTPACFRFMKNKYKSFDSSPLLDFRSPNASRLRLEVWQLRGVSIVVGLFIIVFIQIVHISLRPPLPGIFVPRTAQNVQFVYIGFLRLCSMFQAFFLTGL